MIILLDALMLVLSESVVNNRLIADIEHPVRV